MTTLTLEERERRAYIEGRIDEAALLALAEDGDEELQQRIDWMEEDNSRLQRENDDLAAGE